MNDDLELPTELEAEEESTIVPLLESVLPSIKFEEGHLKTLMVTSISDNIENEFPVILALLKGESGELKSMSYHQSTYKQSAIGVATVLLHNAETNAYWKSNMVNAMLNEGVDSVAATKAAESFLEGFMNEFLNDPK